VYRILAVKDAHCSGSIVTDEDVFTIEHLAQPSLALSPDAGVPSKDGSLVRPAVCLGVEDQFALKMQGQAPFSISYTHLHTYKGHRTQTKPLTLGAVQSVKTFPLETSDPGQHTYTFSAVGDTHYLPITSGLLSPARSGNLVVHQEVYARPSAAFEIQSTPISLCSNAVLSPASSGAKGIILLQGKAPFDLELNIRTVTSPTPVVKWIRGIKTNEWNLDVPDFEFAFVGTYQVAIASVRDATGCEEEVLGEEGRSVKVEVAETASVVAVSKQRDVCVGQSLQFMLRGQAPWTLS
jgi:nucleoporin POM152